MLKAKFVSSTAVTAQVLSSAAQSNSPLAVMLPSTTLRLYLAFSPPLPEV
jgi:hypothetical protein